jgi:hypothetical protein
LAEGLAISIKYQIPQTPQSGQGLLAMLEYFAAGFWGLSRLAGLALFVVCTKMPGAACFPRFQLIQSLMQGPERKLGI